MRLGAAANSLASLLAALRGTRLDSLEMLVVSAKQVPAGGGKMRVMDGRNERERWGDPIAWAMYDRFGPRYQLAVLALDLAALYLVFGVGVSLLPAWITRVPQLMGI